MTYRTRLHDTLDLICWRHYGSRPWPQMDTLYVAVLAANPHLRSLPVVLPAGVMITLPDRPRTVAATARVKLWD